MQLLMEHALLLYLGGRLPPRLLRGRDWPEERALKPDPPYLRTAPKRFSVRIPRRMARWARVWAAEADISDQALITRALDWYIQTGEAPPFKKDAKRDLTGQLLNWRRLVAFEFTDSRESVIRASALLLRRRLSLDRGSAAYIDGKFGGGPGNPPHSQGSGETMPRPKDSRRKTTI